MKVSLSAYRRVQHTRAPIIAVVCPRCGAVFGEPCIEPRGTVSELAHIDRLQVLMLTPAAPDVLTPTPTASAAVHRPVAGQLEPLYCAVLGSESEASVISELSDEVPIVMHPGVPLAFGRSDASRWQHDFARRKGIE